MFDTIANMSDYYKAQRSRNLYEPTADKPFKLSRSKLDLFISCPRCFYLDRRLGVGRPPGFPFALNSAVDALLKQEFDLHRANNTQHPLLEKYGVDARPVAHKDLEVWRANFQGVQYLHEPTNLLITGAIDDLWQNSQQQYIVVDYKATAKAEPITALDKDWHAGYKRQMEIYQWLLRQNGYDISSTGYFVYCNGKMDKQAFDARLEFDITLIPYEGHSDWVEGAITNAHACLNSKTAPSPASDCDYCAYVQAAAQYL